MPSARRKAPPPPPPPSEEQIGPDEEQIPEPEDRTRTSKFQKLEVAVQGIYVTLGGALTVLPVQMIGPRAAVVGRSFLAHANEIAAAWIDLAEDDPRVRKVLESFTSFSGWGKVIGLHLYAIGGGMPGVMGAKPQQQQQQRPTGGMGMDDLQAMMTLAQMFQQQQSQARAQSDFGAAPPPPAEPNGPAGPDPELVRRMMFEQQQRQEAARTQAPGVARRPAPSGIFAPGRGAGIPSPSDLTGGPTLPPEQVDFPTAGPENINK